MPQTMSSHFKYEIDERSIRLRLKEKEMPFTEDAWQRYENYANLQKTQGSESLLSRAHITVNRNLVLPAVFGAVIVLFSLLLFNFITIKNPVQAASAAPLPEPAHQQEEPREKAAIALPAVTVKQPEQEQVVSSTPTVETSMPAGQPVMKHESTTPASNPITASAESTSAETTSAKRSSSEVSELNAQEHTPVVRKKRRQRDMVVTEPTAEEAEVAPPPAETTPQ